MPNSTKSYESFKAHFTRSLRELCQDRGSMNQICRDLSVNRQQFAKYLSGSNLPSLFMLQKIAAYFSVEPNRFFMDEAKKAVVSARPPGTAKQAVDLAEGYYMEHSSLVSGSAHVAVIGLWLLESEDGGLSGRGQLPGFKGPRSPVFERYDGTVEVASGKYKMVTQTAKGHEESIYILAREAFSPGYLVGVRLISNVRDDLPQIVPCVLRYVAPNVDVSDVLGSECGIFEEKELSGRSLAAFKLARTKFYQISGL